MAAVLIVSVLAWTVNITAGSNVGSIELEYVCGSSVRFSLLNPTGLGVLVGDGETDIGNLISILYEYLIGVSASVEVITAVAAARTLIGLSVGCGYILLSVGNPR